MRELTELTLTLLALHEDGEDDISAPMLAKAHRAKGYTITVQETLERLDEVRIDIRDKAKQFRIHPFNKRYFFAHRPVVFSLPTDQWEWAIWSADCAETRLAHSYLPIFDASYGIRFAQHNDFLLMVYRYHTMFTTAMKSKHQTDSLINDVRYGCLPEKVVMSIVNRMTRSVAEGIDGKQNLPPGFKKQAAKLQQGLTELLSNIDKDWEREWFERERNRQQTKEKRRHDPNYNPGFKKGYGYKKK
jgi:hypothetical protein